MKSTAVSTMNPAPRIRPDDAARRAPPPSPAPMALPTRTAVACDTPSGTMKVSEAMLMAT